MYALLTSSSTTKDSMEKLITYQQIGYYFLSCCAYIIILGIIYGGIQSFHFHRIFYERDPRWSNYRSLSDTVTDTALILINLLIGSFTIILMVFLCLDRDFSNVMKAEKLKEVLILLISFLTTFAVTAEIVGIAKILFTEPRPSMFYLCNYKGFRDAVDSGNFTSYLALTDPNTIGSTANCWDRDFVPDCIYSFPSGHSALSFCSMFWLVLFFSDHLRKPSYAPWIRYYRFLVFFPLILAFYIAYSRVYDYRHSELDVTVGALIGVTGAYLFYSEYSDFFRESQKGEETASLNQNPMMP